MFENHTQNLPEHLKKYIVEQNYSRYTPMDQAVWRYCECQKAHRIHQRCRADDRHSLCHVTPKILLFKRRNSD